MAPELESKVRKWLEDRYGGTFVNVTVGPPQGKGGDRYVRAQRMDRNEMGDYAMTIRVDPKGKIHLARTPKADDE